MRSGNQLVRAGASEVFSGAGRVVVLSSHFDDAALAVGGTHRRRGSFGQAGRGGDRFCRRTAGLRVGCTRTAAGFPGAHVPGTGARWSAHFFVLLNDWKISRALWRSKL
jgi:hypothetical protein